MMWWHSLAYVLTTISFLSYVWFSCANSEYPMIMDHAAVAKFGGFVADVRAATSPICCGIKLVPRWSDFRSYECDNARESVGETSRTYVLDFIAIGLDGREVCLSRAHPAWSFLSSCAGDRGLALLTADDRVWAQYAD